MPRRVLDVGNCSMDHAAIASLLRDQFQAEVVQAHGGLEALSAVRSAPFDLILVNRKLDEDYSDGLEVIKMLKQAPDTAHLPVMLITNYPESQAEAVAIGAEYGFGKKSLQAAETRERLARFLS
jgi:two-component system chemotaxis response regulator CheY